MSRDQPGGKTGSVFQDSNKGPVCYHVKDTGFQAAVLVCACVPVCVCVPMCAYVCYLVGMCVPVCMCSYVCICVFPGVYACACVCTDVDTHGHRGSGRQ